MVWARPLAFQNRFTPDANYSLFTINYSLLFYSSSQIIVANRPVSPSLRKE